MSEATFLLGDVRAVLDTLEPGSVDLVLTSPPFLALRSYLPADHPDKPLEGGSQATPGAFIDWLLDVVEALDRVLAPHGSLCIELGDTYSGSGGAGGDYAEGGLRDGQPTFRQTSGRHRGERDGRAEGAAYRKAGTEATSPTGGVGWPEAKSLCLVPESFRWALAYGRNPFTGRCTPRWRVRNVVRWHRPNPPVGALGDKFRPSTSEIVVACHASDRYFDLTGVRTEAIDQRVRYTNGPKAVSGDSSEVQTANFTKRVPSNPAGAPPLDTWIISTEPYPGSHYATWPSDLCVKPIIAMCPERVCTICGQPSRRIERIERIEPKDDSTRVKRTGRLNGADHPPERGWEMRHETLGWTDCQHDSWRRGLVLDPFAGSGTTLAVATGHGRDAIGIDLDARNLDLARERIGMFLTEPDPPAMVDSPVTEGLL